jgi:hypothetical protein
MHKTKSTQFSKKLAIFEEAESEKAKIMAIKDATDALSDKTVLYYYIKGHLRKLEKGNQLNYIPYGINKPFTFNFQTNLNG